MYVTFCDTYKQSQILKYCVTFTQSTHTQECMLADYHPTENKQRGLCPTLSCDALSSPTLSSAIVDPWQCLSVCLSVGGRQVPAVDADAAERGQLDDRAAD